jgi:hypothetical protein
LHGVPVFAVVVETVPVEQMETPLESFWQVVSGKLLQSAFVAQPGKQTRLC